MRNNYRLLRIELKGKKEDTSMNYELLAVKGDSTLVLVSGCSLKRAVDIMIEASTNVYLKDRSFTLEPVAEGAIPVTKHSLLKK